MLVRDRQIVDICDWRPVRWFEFRPCAISDTRTLTVLVNWRNEDSSYWSITLRPYLLLLSLLSGITLSNTFFCSYGDRVEHFRVLEGGGQYCIWDESFCSLNRLVDFYRTHSIAVEKVICLRDPPRDMSPGLLAHSGRNPYPNPYISSSQESLLSARLHSHPLRDSPHSPVLEPLLAVWHLHHYHHHHHFMILKSIYFASLLLCSEASSGSCPLRLHPSSHYSPPLPAWWRYWPAGLLQCAELEGALSWTSRGLSAWICATAVPLMPYGIPAVCMTAPTDCNPGWTSLYSLWQKAHPITERILKHSISYYKFSSLKISLVFPRFCISASVVSFMSFFHQFTAGGFSLLNVKSPVR